MRCVEPPSLAIWLLEHWTPGGCNDALVGDLLEECRSGRTGAWYWRQVLAAIAIGCTREIRNHRTVLLFAASWSILAPSWLLIVAAFEQHFNLNAHILQLDFPWSTLCDLGLILAANLLFIWAGIVFYLIPHLWLRRNLKVRPLAKGVLTSIPVLAAVWVTLIVLPKQFLHAQATDQRSLAPAPGYAITHLGPTKVRRISPELTWTAGYSDKAVKSPEGENQNAPAGPLNAITDMRRSALLVRLPFLFCVLCTLWGVTSRLRNRHDGIAA
jgi:hypothetical protein